MDVVRGSYPQKISVYNKATIRATDGPQMYRRMEPFIAGKAEEWIIKVTEQTHIFFCIGVTIYLHRRNVTFWVGNIVGLHI